MTSGGSLVAGRWTTDGTTFHAVALSTGRLLPREFRAATSADIAAACAAAAAAFDDFSVRSGAERGRLLCAIAAEVGALGDELIRLAARETGLAEDRLRSERDRTVMQLCLAGDLVGEGSWVEAIIDHGDALRTPTPKPDLRRMLRPLGPVAVFGASNFPLAYSVAGGDTASALAGGCPVVVKGHAAHPGTGEMVAAAVAQAVQKCGLPAGTFSFLQSGGPADQQIGATLVQNPHIRAVGFTGSVPGGNALDAMARNRSEPIPVFAEMGSVNPVFILPHALESRGGTIAARLAASVTSSSGQMCTCPGLIFVTAGESAEQFIAECARLIGAAGPQSMLSPRTRDNFLRRTRELGDCEGVQAVVGAAATGPGRGSDRSSEAVCAPAVLLRTTRARLAERPMIAEEAFGPGTVVVVCEDAHALRSAARENLPGSLTASIWAEGSDAALAREIHPLLCRRAGRVIFNGVPTGVEVCGAMVHSGPFPACNRPDSTAVGPLNIRRWCRPVAFQNTPEVLLPAELRESNPLSIFRVVDGRRTEPQRARL